MRVLVFSPVYAGHCLHYLHHLVAAVLELTDQVVVCVPADAVATPWFEHYLAPHGERILLDATLRPRRPGHLISALAEAHQLQRAVRTFAPGHVLLPAGDGLAQALAVRRMMGSVTLPAGVEAEALVLRGTFAYLGRGLSRWLRTRITLGLLAGAPLDLVHLLDPRVFHLVQAHGGPLARRCRLMPEPAEEPSSLDRGTARQRLGIAVAGRLVGSIGFMTRRKGIDLLLEAFAHADLADDDRLLLAGTAEPAIRALLDGRYSDLVSSGRVVVVDRVLGDDELPAAVAALDLVCAPHPAHIGSSGVVVRAARAGRPLLASSFGWIGRTVERFALGRTCTVRDRAAFARAITASLDEASRFEPGPAAQRFCTFHTADNFRLAWTARLRQRLGLPPATNAVSWSWVCEAPEPAAGRAESSGGQQRQ
jgi:glycosyltransferase involved in cell wall biosynthesis